MKEAAIHLVKAIRHHYPQTLLMINRAYSLLPDVAKDVDMVLGECVYADYNFKRKIYELVPEKEYRKQVKRLQDIQQAHPHLQIFTLDYWNPKDVSVIKEIYRKQRKNGFIPYVSTIDLTKIIS